MTYQINKVVFPVAGLGTRFLPATKSIPKELLPIVDKPLIQYATDEATAAGAKTLIFITSNRKHAISDHFDSVFELEHKLSDQGAESKLATIKGVLADGVSCVYIPQAEALGLGHAVACARPVIGDEYFAVILADDLIHHEVPCLSQMLALHQKTGHSIIGVETVPSEYTDRYGIVETNRLDDGSLKVTSIVEKPAPEDAPSNLAVVGRYILSPKIFDLLDATKPGAGGEIQLTDAISRMLAEETLLAFPFEGQRYDCGNKLGFVQATIDYALEDPHLREQCFEYMKNKIRT